MPRFLLKLSRYLSAAFFLALISNSEAANVLVNQPEPYPQHALADTAYSIYYGASGSGMPYNGAFFDKGHGYRFLKVNAVDDLNLIWLDVSTNQTFPPVAGQKVFVSLSTSSTAGNEISLRGAGTVTSNTAPPLCNTGGTTTCPGINGSRASLSAIYTPGTVIRLSFAVSDLCQTPGVSLLSQSICTTGNVINTTPGATNTTQIVAAFTAGPMPTTTPIPTTGATVSQTFNLVLTDLSPVVSCPSSGNIEDFYFPGDGQIFFSPENFGSSVGPVPAVGLSVGVPLQSLVLLADQNPVPLVSDDKMPAVSVVGYKGISGKNQTVDGFSNIAENGAGYSAAVYAENVAGIISLPTSSNSCLIFPDTIKPRPVLGVLNESKCFIATAAYHDGHAGPVMMLRQFRDEILARTAFGQKFIDTYYHYSPALAEWAWDKPFVRSFALRALAPFELVAWAMLKIAHAEDGTPQPYIDKLKKKLDESNPGPSPSSESYIESERRKLGPEPTPGDESYIGELKRKLGPSESSGGFTEAEKKKLPAETERESPIKMVNEGRDRFPKPERPPIKNGVSFKLGVSPGVQVTNTANAVTFGRIYGIGWQPDLILHYERQLVHSENLGSLALATDVGFSYAVGFGQLAYGFGSTNSTQSITKLSFLQIPLIVSGYYRFNLLRVLRPYVGLGAGSMFFTEIRKDNAGSKYGYSFLYAASIGTSLLLDFFDSATSLDGYLSSGIQHTYLFAEYTRVQSFNQTGVSFERNGVYSGFLFEF